MSVKDAQVIIEKPSGTVPKNTSYVFPFKIIAPDYGKEVVTRVLNEMTVSPLDSGKVTEVKLDSGKFSEITELKVNNGTAQLIKSGDGTDKLFSFDSVTNSVVQVGTGSPTVSLFISKGTTGAVVGESSVIVPLAYANVLGSGFVYKNSIPSIFDKLSSIRII